MSSKRDRPSLRLLFDEQLSARVARALYELGFRVSHVGNANDGAPRLGAPDDEILAHATRTNQVVVTTDHGMIVLAAELGIAVLWVDPRGRPFTVDQLALLCFQRIHEWERLFQDAGRPVCIRALRTKSEVLELEEAAHLAALRRRKLTARPKARKPRPLGPLYSE